MAKKKQKKTDNLFRLELTGKELDCVTNLVEMESLNTEDYKEEFLDSLIEKLNSADNIGEVDVD